MSKSIFKSRTFWLAVVQGVAGVLLVIPMHSEWGWLVIAKSVVDVLLRALTTQPVEL